MAEKDKGILEIEIRALKERQKAAFELEETVIVAKRRALEASGRALQVRREALIAEGDALERGRRALEASIGGLQARRGALEAEGDALEMGSRALEASREVLEIEKSALAEKVKAFEARSEKEKDKYETDVELEQVGNVEPHQSSIQLASVATSGPPADKELATMRYSSGEKIQPADKVECEGGLTGEVKMVMTGGSESHPAFQIGDRFFVEWDDGTYADYPSEDPSVRLLSHEERMSSSTMHVTIKKAEFLALLEDLGSHTLYYPEPLSKQLADCGLSTTVAADGQGLVLEGQLIPLSTPEWGEPGISPLHVLSTVYELATGRPPTSNMTGRGFRFNSVMKKLATHWGLAAKYG